MKFRILQALTLIALAALAPLGRTQTQIAGDWLGTLNAGGAELRIALHITAAKDGSLAATLDSVDQGANGIPVTSVTLKDSKLSLVVDAIHGTYEGTVNKDATEIDGTWTQQGQPLALNFKRGVAPPAATHKPATPSDIDGTWQGKLNAGAVQPRILFKIVNTQDGLTAQMQSPDQSPVWMQTTSVTRSGSSITITMKGIGAVFEGKISPDLSSIDGTFTQMGNPMPLVVKRVKNQAELEPRRPQNPVKPYPYREEEVAYTNKAAGNTLAATLTIPPGKGPFPAVLLIVGSGPNDRGESLMGHKPFLVLFDSLTRRGIVVLRADKRGIGKSSGDLTTATTADFAADAEAGIEYLRTRPEADSRRIGLIGHSEGGRRQQALRDRRTARPQPPLPARQNRPSQRIRRDRHHHRPGCARQDYYLDSQAVTRPRLQKSSLSRARYGRFGALIGRWPGHQNHNEPWKSVPRV